MKGKPNRDAIEHILLSGRFEPDADYEKSLRARLRQLLPDAAPLENGRRPVLIHRNRESRALAGDELAVTGTRWSRAMALGLAGALVMALALIVLLPPRAPVPTGPATSPPTDEPALDTTAVPPAANPDARPSLSFMGDELEDEGCAPTFMVAGELSNESRSPEDYAANVEIGPLVIKGEEFVQRVELDPAAWERIEPAQRVSFHVIVTLDPALWRAAPDETEVKLRIVITGETNRSPGAYRTRTTVTLVKRCYTGVVSPTGGADG